MKISRVPNGSNVCNLQVSAPVNYEKLVAYLKDKERIQIRTPDRQGNIKFFINETVLKRSNDSNAAALNRAISSSLS